MSLKTSRITALAGALVAVGLMSVATASASVTPPTRETCPLHETEEATLLGPIRLVKPVSGSLTPKKLNQPIPLEKGSFTGTITLCVEEQIKVTGTITQGEVAFPAFTAHLKILGVATEVGMEIKQVGAGEGTITRPAGNEEEEPIQIALNVQAQANIGFTTIGILGLKLPTKCETEAPVQLPLVKKLSLIELLEGTTITGTATMPKVKCQGPLGIVEGALLSALFSGPGNPFSLTFGETKVVE